MDCAGVAEVAVEEDVELGGMLGVGSIMDRSVSMPLKLAGRPPFSLDLQPVVSTSSLAASVVPR
jgi:hypothetical protein